MKPIDRGTWLALGAMGIAVFVIANHFSAINVARCSPATRPAGTGRRQ